MTSEQFLRFLEGKLRKHGVGKMVPTPDALAKGYRCAMEAEIVNRRIQSITEAAHEQSQSAKIPAGLDKKVRRLLKANQSIPWDAAVAQIAAENL